MAPRLVVIGGGVIGLNAANHAARLGAEVTVVERDHLASGSSGLSMGIFNRQTPDLREMELRIRSVEGLERLEAERGLVLERCGYVRLATNAADLEHFERTASAERSFGLDGARVLSRRELGELVPDLRRDDLAGGLYGPTDGTFDGHLVCAALQEEGADLGVRLLVRSPVTAVEADADRIVLSTPSGTLEADRVINAAGPWAEQVGRLLGVESPLRVQRHAICVGKLDAPLPYNLPTLNEYVPGSGDYALVVRPDGSDRLLAMLHSHEALADAPSADPDDYHRGVEFDYVERVAAKLAHRFESLVDHLSLEGGWAGLYPISPDHRFQVGPYPEDPRIIAAAGVGGVGITVSPAVGALAAEWAVKGRAKLVGFARELLPGRHRVQSAVADRPAATRS